MPTFICPKMGKSVNLETGQTYQINSVAVVNQDVTTTGTPTFAKVNIDSTKGAIDSDANGQLIINYNSGADGAYSVKVYDGSTNFLFGIDRTGGLSLGNATDNFVVSLTSQSGAGNGAYILSYRGGANAWSIGDEGHIIGGDTSDLVLYGFSTNDIHFYPRTALTATVNNVGINLASGKVLQVNGTQVVGAQVVDARLADTPNSGDATTDGLIDALRDLVIAHGLGSAT